MMQHVMGRNKLRSLFSVVLVFSLLLSSFPSIAFADEPTSIRIGTVSGNPGDIVSVPVYLNPGDYSVYGYQLNFNYNFNDLEPVTEKLATSTWESSSFNTHTNSSLEVSVQASFGEEHIIKDGEQKVFELNFRIKDNAEEGSAHVMKSSGSFTGANESTVNIDNDQQGSVTINAGSGTGSGEIQPTEAQAPQITGQPTDKNVRRNDTSVQLNVTASVSDGGQLSYQWFARKNKNSGGFEQIEGATDSSYEVSTSTLGTSYYYVEIKNTLGSSTNVASSSTVAVAVNPAWIDITGAEAPVSNPVDIAVDPNGTVYVANSTTIKKRPSNGDWIDITPEGAEYISGIAADSKGTIYVSQSRSSSILKYMDDAWGVVNGTNEGLSTPVDVAVDENDQIFVADSEFNTVKRLTNGTWESVSESRVYTPVGLAVGHGNVYVTYDNFVEFGVKTLLDGVWGDITAGTRFNMPQGIAADASGNVYVADSRNSVVKKLSDGVWTTFSTEGDFSVPSGVAVGHNGDLYVADYGTGNIKMLIANAKLPIINEQPIGDIVEQGSEGTKLSVNATVYDGGSLSYQWYSNTENNVEGATLIEGATESSYSVPTNQAGEVYYYLKVMNTNTAAIQNQTAWVNSSVVQIITKPTKAQSPQITRQPVDRSVSLNDLSPQLKVVANVNDGGQLSYQWYRNTKKSVESGNIEKIAGATESRYDAPTSTVGITYYFVEVTNTLGETSTTTPSTIATVLVSKGSWQDITGPEASFIGANGIAVDPSGTVYVISGMKIVKRTIDSDWQDITPADGEEREDFYTGIAADSKGTIYVSRSNNGSILKYAGDTWETIDSSGLSNPSHLAVDEQDQVYVVDRGDVIKKLVDGTWENFGSINSYISSLVVTGGKLYASHSNGVTVKTLWNDSSEEVVSGVQFIMLIGMTADANGNVYVADSEGVKKLSNGEATPISTKADFSIPYGLALDSIGNLYAVDNQLGKVKKLIINAATPVIHTDLVDLKVDQGSESPQLIVNATVSDSGTLSYQWYSNTNDSVEGATLIEGATESSYSVPTDQAGKVYYYVKVKNTNDLAAQNQTSTVNSLVVAVTVDSVNLPAYNVFFNRQDGTAPFSMGVTQGSKIPVMIVKERAGYTFEGWYKDAAGTLKWNNDTDVVNSDVTLYAKWTAISSGSEGGNGSGTGNTGSNNSVSAGATPAGTPAPTNDAVVVLVNGKEERIGKSVASKEGERTVTTITVDQKQLDTKLDAEGQGAVVTIPVSAESNIIIGELTGQMIKKMEDKQAILIVKTGNASYSIPARQLDIDSISRQLGSMGTLEDIKLSLRIASPEAAMMKVAEDAAKQNALTLVAPSIDFTVKAEFAGKSVDINKFNVYVERSIALPEGIDPSKITTGIVTDPDGSVRHVPTKVTLENGKYFAHINSLTNSLYSVVWHPLTFKDVESHWAKDAVNDMGSRLIVNGSGSDLYNPDADMTRAEFAAIMMRGLGLKPIEGNSPFADVKASDWYHSAVLTAYDYKLIDGFEDGTFRPQEKISREQAMVILSKAMAITGLADKLADKGNNELLTPYTDASLVADWAKVGVAASLEAGIVSGRGAEQLAPKANITRAEVAAIVQRLLKVSGLI
ncbi:S-layer homology domain-containing protein [Paenibacillus sp. RRE4]|uniref:S-layer homology domain-containing protein n=1 Tax=Paenibacillus sp. RRE4 TaxID=2962587 RepID=UPI002881C655|nr:S-layer homology domain-containing protein [Paenibacillus sp. RRE4]MDT0125357.1 S-layer homology domain-containing protein [Paenibacillus sp. RRE4]